MITFVTSKKDAIEAYLQTRNKIVNKNSVSYDFNKKAFLSDKCKVIISTPDINRIFRVNKLLMLNTFPLFYFIHKLNYNRNQIDGKKDKFISGLKLFGLGALGTLIALVILPLMLPVLLVAHPINHLIDKIKKNKDPLEEQCKKVDIEKFTTLFTPLLEKITCGYCHPLDLDFVLKCYVKMIIDQKISTQKDLEFLLNPRHQPEGRSSKFDDSAPNKKPEAPEVDNTMNTLKNEPINEDASPSTSLTEADTRLVGQYFVLIDYYRKYMCKNPDYDIHNDKENLFVKDLQNNKVLKGQQLKNESTTTQRQ